MEYRKYGRLVIRLAATMILIVACIPPASAQQPTSDWAQRMMRLHRDPQLARSRQTEIKKLERWVVNGKYEKALAEGTRIAAELVRTSNPGDSGELLGTVNVLRALAAYNSGDRRQALWLWQASLQILPELAHYDLSRYGEAADFLQRNPPRTGDCAGSVPASALENDASPKDVVAPVKKHVPPPRFPPARPETMPLEVVVNVIIDEMGRPTSPRVVQADGDVPLVFASLEAFGSWEFEPATQDGEPTEFVTNLTVKYRTGD